MRFSRPPDFSITKHLSESLGVFSTNGRFKVRLEFDDFAARLVSERNWHPSQKIKQLPGGTIELRLELGSLEEIGRWILSWGAHARVLEPAELKKRILVAATAILSAG